MGTNEGNRRGCPGLLVSRPLDWNWPLGPRQSQGGNWGGGALQLHEFSLWRGATGHGEQAAANRGETPAPPRRHRAGLRFLPLERRRLALLAARKLASTEAGRRLTCVCQELEGGEGDAGRGQGRERAQALKHLALSSGAQGNLAPRASPSQGARSGRARPWRGVRCSSSYRNMGTLKIHAMSPVHYV